MKRLLIVNANHSPATLEGCRLIGKRMRALAELDIEILHYAELTPAGLAARAPDVVVVGPQGTPWWRYDAAALAPAHAALRAVEAPTLGICGGHQFLAMAFGGQVAPLSPACHVDTAAATYAGLSKEKGPTALTAVAADPLLDGLAAASFEQSHSEEVKHLPAGWKTLMSGGLSKIQAMRHARRPIYGVQFHPERHWRELPAGRRLMANFVKLAKLS